MNIFLFVLGPDRFSECLKLITEHKLYRQALSLFPFGREDYKVGYY